MPIIVPSSGLIDLALIEPYVLPALSGTPLETVMFQAANAAREFCRRTLIWFEPLATLQTVVDQNAYMLALPDDAEVHKLLAVTIGEQPKTSSSADAALGQALRTVAAAARGRPEDVRARASELAALVVAHPDGHASDQIPIIERLLAGKQPSSASRRRAVNE